MMCEESEELKCELNKCDKKTSKFSLDGLVKLCKVVDVYDGDTCRVVFKHNSNISKWNIRMNGYDSPEMRPSKKLENRDEIKKKAIEAKNYLKSLIMNENQFVYLKCGKFDKYGRLLIFDWEPFLKIRSPNSNVLELRSSKYALHPMDQASNCITIRSDLFATGTLLMQALYGRYPGLKLIKRNFNLISKISEDTLNPQHSIQKMFSFAKGIL